MRYNSIPKILEEIFPITITHSISHLDSGLHTGQCYKNQRKYSALSFHSYQSFVMHFKSLFRGSDKQEL